MRPEFTRAVGGKRGVEALNMAARLGRPIGQRFARGGVVAPLAGGRYGTYPGHDGVDINVGSGWDDYGMPIRAFRDGSVSYVGSGRGYGTAVFQRGSFGEVVYGHMSRTAVSSGQSVRAGQVLGYVGNTGNSSAPHLHFGYPGGSYAQAMALLAGATGIFGGTKAAPNPGEEKKEGFLDAIKSIPSIAKTLWANITGMGSRFGDWGSTLKGGAVSAMHSGVNWLDDFIPNKIAVNNFPDVPMPDNPVSDLLKKLGIFDNGGVLEPGKFAYNASNKPEAVFNQSQFKQFAESAGNKAAAFPREVTLNVEGQRFRAYVSEVARDEIDEDYAYTNNVRGMSR